MTSLLKSALILTLFLFDLLSMSGTQAESFIGITQPESKKVLDIAAKKARQLGYDLEKLEQTVDREGDLYVVDFYRKQEGKDLIYGGGLSVWIDKRGKVVRFEHQI